VKLQQALEAIITYSTEKVMRDEAGSKGTGNWNNIPQVFYELENGPSIARILQQYEEEHNDSKFR
jgi:hypothetical protein